MTVVHTSLALTLRSQPQGEQDRRLVLLTPERGLVHAMAKGAQRHGHRLAGACDVLAYGTATLSSGRQFEVLTQYQPELACYQLRQNLTALACGLSMAEIACRFAAPDHEDASLWFALVWNHLQSLDALIMNHNMLPYEAMSYWLRYAHEVLNLAGYPFAADCCCQCAAPLVLHSGKVYGLQMALGGCCCVACQQQPDSAQQAVVPVSGSTLLLYQHCLSNNNAQALAATSTPEAWQKLLRLCRYLLEYRCESTLRSVDFLQGQFLQRPSLLV